ncbi:hypothetical protein BBP40_004052 [Aspergillus hancockii]|nr:hypothetical protein BBP40_004052 [Aspergillus hancockii]
MRPKTNNAPRAMAQVIYHTVRGYRQQTQACQASVFGDRTKDASYDTFRGKPSATPAQDLLGSLLQGYHLTFRRHRLR